MKGSFRIGKLMGIQLEVHVSWMIIFALITFMMATSYFPINHPDVPTEWVWILSAGMAFFMLFSILLHELSHSIVAKNEGIQVDRITLFVFGGIAQMASEPDEPLKELKIALAGPAMSLTLFLLLSGVVVLIERIGVPEHFVAPFVYVRNINLAIAIFNLVPAFPLDGGRVLRAIIWHVKGSVSDATKVASAMGSGFGYMLIILGVYFVLVGNTINGVWFVLIGWFIRNLSESSYQNTVMTDLFTKIKVSTFMTKSVVTVEEHWSIDEWVKSYLYPYKFTCFPVLSNGIVTGVVTIENLKNISRDRWQQEIIRNIRTPLKNNMCVSPEDTVSQAMKKIFENGLGRVLVIEETQLLGIISRTDILNHIRIHSQLKED